MEMGTRTPLSIGSRRRTARLLCTLALLLGLQSLQADELLDRGAALQRQGKLKEAAELFSAKAKVGDPLGAYGMGVVYFQGKGVPMDMAQSTHWFGIAAEQGYAPAQYNLGNAYLHGRGVAKNLDQAELWWRKAAQQGYTRAQYNLGALLHGNGTTATMREEGIAWIRASAESGFDKSLKKLKEIGEPVDYRQIEPDPTREPLRSEARLMTFNPRGITTQLFSGSKLGSAERFIADEELGGAALAFRFSRGGKLWTAVVYGEYETQEQAKSALASLGSELKNAKPWIRPLADIQKQIRQRWRNEETPP
jgi:TPR repeat protein